MTAVAILLDGIDVTASVLYATARFESQVNGAAGSAYLRIRDPDRTLTIIPGSPLQLLIDGAPTWTGYAMQAKRVYVFPALNVDAFGETRFLDVEGVDLNVLFTRRIVFKQSDPDNVAAPVYPPNTPDTTAISELVANWLDLSGDAIDTSTLVDNVGDINVDQDAVPWSGSHTWGQAMGSIAMLPAAIYYLDPTRNLVYTDVDTPNAPFTMTDVAAGGGGSVSLTDPFDRTVSSGPDWGTGAIGAWTSSGGTYSVDGSKGIYTGAATEDASVPAPVEYDNIVSATLSATFRWPTGSFSSYAEFALAITEAPDPTVNFAGGAVVYEEGLGDFYVYAFSNTGFEVFPLPGAPSLGDLGHLKIDIDSVTGNGRAKFWADGDPEPDWQVTVTLGLGDFSVAKLARLFFTTDDTQTWNADDVTLAAVAAGGGGAAGYREMEILLDGSSLANDVLAWGFGYSSQTPVFVRDQDATSQTAHGLWQSGEIRFGVYRQATINQIAASIIDGSPQSHRGAKNDRPAVTIVTYTPGFLPAQKVDFTSEVFGWSDVIPIRKMNITFEAPENPRFELTLSHEIDAPWNFIDPFLLNWSFPPFPPFNFPPFPFPFPGPAVCTTDICGITDSFSRVTSQTEHLTASSTPYGAVIGTSDCGLQWAVTLSGGGASIEVDGAALLISLFKVSSTIGPGSSLIAMTTDFPLAIGSAHSFRFRLRQLPGADSDRMTIRCGIAADGTEVIININPSGTFFTNSFIGFSGGGGNSTIPDTYWAIDTWYTVTVLDNGTTSTAEISNGAVGFSHSASPPITGTQIVNPYLIFDRDVNVVSDPHGQIDIEVDDVDVPEVTRCSNSRFDNFNRTVAVGLGTSTDGHAWEDIGDGSLSVDGSRGRFSMSPGAGTAWGAVTDAAGPWTLSTYTMTSQFSLSNVPTTSPSSLWDISLGPAIIQVSATAGPPDSPPASWIKVGTGAVSYVPPAFWQAGVTYTITLDVAGGNGTLTVQGPSAGYAVQGAVSPSSVFSAKCQLFAALGSGSKIVYFDYINFDYIGKPCYTDCVNGTGTFVIDDFQRSVGSGWGTASSGAAWSKTAVAGTTTESVDGSSGKITTTGGNQITDMTLVTPAYAALKESVEVRWLVSTTADDIVAGVYDSAFSQGLIWFTDGTGLKYGRPGSSQVLVAGGGGSFTMPLDNTPFWVAVKGDFGAAEIKGKVWLDSEAEPDWNATSVGIGTLVGEDIVRSVVRGGSSTADAGTRSIGHIEASYPDTTCTPIMPAATTALNAYVCESISANGTTVTLDHAYLPNSAIVFVRGLLQRKGTDYTEDPAAGTITLTVAPTTGDPIRVCYWSLP